MTRAQALATAAGVAIALGTFEPVIARQLPSTGKLLERYERGDFAAFTPPASAIDLDRFRQALQHDAQSFLRGDAKTLRRRQVVVATIALEAAHASLGLDWGRGRQLIEWGSDLLRKAPPDDAERLWHLGALAVAQGAYDRDLLVGLQKVAWPRFQSEPRFALALAVILESDTFPDPDRGSPWEDDADLKTGTFEPARRERMRQAIQVLEDLSDIEPTRPEVLLRLGALHLRLQNSEVAIDQFEEVSTLTDEPFLVYLAEFLKGRALEVQGDRANAIASYRAALAAVPRAQSATFSLASLLFIGDGQDEAARLIEAAVAAPFADDPWRSYSAGDFRFWKERLADLRGVIR